MERKLRYLEKEIRRDGIPMLEIPGECPEAPQPREMIDLEVTVSLLFYKQGSPNFEPLASCSLRGARI